MKDMKDFDNLLDNFEVHSFWQKRRLLIIFGVYMLHSAIVGGIMIKSVINASNAGAVPKGTDVKFPGNPTVVR